MKRENNRTATQCRSWFFSSLSLILMSRVSFVSGDSRTNKIMNASGGQKYCIIVDALVMHISLLAWLPPLLPTILYFLGDACSLNLLAKFCRTETISHSVSCSFGRESNFVSCGNLTILFRVGENKISLCHLLASVADHKLFND